MKKLTAFALSVLLLLSCIAPAGAYRFNNNGTATKKATAYRLPSVNSGDVWWVDKNDKLEVFCRDGNFYLVLYPFNNTGKHVLAYVPTSAVSASGVPDASAFYENETVWMKESANLYHNPSADKLIGASGSNQTVRSTVSKGQEVTVLFEKDGFYCIRTSNDTGFVEKNKICTHSNTEKQKKSSGKAVNIGDSTYHSVTVSYKEVCSDCDFVTSSNTTETQNEKHSWLDNKCTDCGYEAEVVDDTDVCKHEKTYFSQNYTYGSPDMDIKVKDDEYHIGYHYADEYCLACKALVNKRVIVEEESPHTYWNGYCTSCLHTYFTEKPDVSQLSINKTTFKPGENIVLNWTHAERTAGYDIHIYKEGMSSRYKLLSGYKDPAATIQISDVGVYSLAIYAVNNVGYTASNIIKITVQNPFAEKPAWVYKTEGANLNIRSAANLKASIVGKIPEGNSLTVTGDSVNGFYPVKYGKVTGYASTAYITFTKPTTSTPTTGINNSKTAKKQAILSSMMNGTSHNGVYKVGKKYTGPYANEQCKGFAKSVFQQLFGYNIGSTTNNGYGYEINYQSSKTTHLGTLTSLTATNVKNLFAKARPGDFIQMHQKGSYNGPHSAIVYEVSSNGVTFYECNLDWKNTIAKKYYTWNQIVSGKSKLSLYTAKGY